MLSIRTLVAPVCLLLLVVVATTPLATSAQEPVDFHIRFVHAVAGGPAVAIYSGDAVIFPSLSYKSATGYASAAQGYYNLTVKVAGTDSVLYSAPNIRLIGIVTYTITGNVSNPSSIGLIADEDITPVVFPAGQCGVRFFHAAFGAPTVTLWVDGHIDSDSIAFGTRFPTPGPAGSQCYSAPGCHQPVGAGQAAVSLSVYPSFPTKFVVNATIKCPSAGAITVYAMGGLAKAPLELVTVFDE